MGLSCRQLRFHIIRPTLQILDMWSLAAENLLVGTAAQESGGFRYIDQVTGPDDTTLGPAYGLYQVEKKTLNDVYKHFLSYRPELLQKVDAFRSRAPGMLEQLVGNIPYSTAICRVNYFRRPERLPAPDNLAGLARYWKLYHNTISGKGTEAEFISNYRRHVD
jgi:hypothetical protein